MEKVTKVYLILGGNFNRASAIIDPDLDIWRVGFPHEVKEVLKYIPPNCIRIKIKESFSFDTFTNFLLDVRAILKKQIHGKIHIFVPTSISHFNRGQRSVSMISFFLPSFLRVKLIHIDYGEKDTNIEKYLVFLYRTRFGILSVCFTAWIMRIAIPRFQNRNK